MTVEELKQKIEAYREGLKTKPLVEKFTNPAAVVLLIDAVASVLQTHEKRMAEIESQLVNQ